MRHAGVFLFLLATAALTSSDIEAQSAQAISLQVSGLFNGVLFGNAFTGLQNGLGGEAQIRYTPGALSVGAGFQYTTHDLEDRPIDARLYGGFVEPRYRIYAGSSVVAPYLSARLSVLKIGFSDSLAVSSAFIQLNGGGGLLFRLGSRVNADAGATYGYNRLLNGTLHQEGRDPRKVSGSGANIIVRLGVAVGLGG
jgi:hypothetical protein